MREGTIVHEAERAAATGNHDDARMLYAEALGGHAADADAACRSLTRLTRSNVPSVAVPAAHLAAELTADGAWPRIREVHRSQLALESGLRALENGEAAAATEAFGRVLRNPATQTYGLGRSLMAILETYPRHHARQSAAANSLVGPIASSTILTPYHRHRLLLRVADYGPNDAWLGTQRAAAGLPGPLSVLAYLRALGDGNAPAIDEIYASLHPDAWAQALAAEPGLNAAFARAKVRGAPLGNAATLARALLSWEEELAVSAADRAVGLDTIAQLALGAGERQLALEAQMAMIDYFSDALIPVLESIHRTLVRAAYSSLPDSVVEEMAESIFIIPCEIAPAILQAFELDVAAAIAPRRPAIAMSMASSALDDPPDPDGAVCNLVAAVGRCLPHPQDRELDAMVRRRFAERWQLQRYAELLAEPHQAPVRSVDLGLR